MQAKILSQTKRTNQKLNKIVRGVPNKFAEKEFLHFTQYLLSKVKELDEKLVEEPSSNDTVQKSDIEIHHLQSWSHMFTKKEIIERSRYQTF